MVHFWRVWYIWWIRYLFLTKNDILWHYSGVGIICRQSIKKNRVLNFSCIPNKRSFQVSSLWCRPKKLPKQVASLVTRVFCYTPRGSYRKGLVNYLLNCIDNVLLYPKAGIMMSGDFSDLDPKWKTNSLSLKQIVNVPTRGNCILDLIFTSFPEYYNTQLHYPH